MCRATAPFPKRVHVELTTYCNLRCVFCAHSQADGFSHIESEVVELLERVLIPNVDEIELQGTGESLLFPEFSRVLQACSDRDCGITLITNGTLLNAERMRELVTAGCQLVVSLDGAVPDTFEFHRRGARFGQVFANLLQWKSLRRLPSATSHTASLSLSITLTARNVSEVGAVVQLADRIGADAVFASVVRRSIAGEAMWRELCLDGRTEEVRAALQQGSAEARQAGIVFDSSSLPFGDSVARDNDVVCPAPWEHVYIGCGGDVFPCCQFRSSMGNCRRERFEEIWRGGRFTALRQEIERGKCPEECRRCVLPWSPTRKMR